ncbi:prophage endopeptidase tail family protein [Bacillus weihaiensis]|uniref:prophage endopeptidase tail family protein n=1 Tax=Bacillus weihaiensis TaxID=1547283 RepID=UPI002355A8B9|nr:prophage endopeptidase tail family protein [Bacillus weihaiensis]
MPDLFVWSLDKTKKERLTEYSDLSRKWKVNNLNAISFSVFRDELNQRAFDLMEEKGRIEYDGTLYTIEDLDKTPIGDTQVAEITAEHVFFDEFMNRSYVYTVLTNAKRSLNAYMSFIIPNTGYTFSVIDSFDSKEIENFGAGNPLELFKKLLETFEAEFTVVGTDIRLYKRIGSQTAYPFRYKHNISDITKSGSARNLSTYIRGFGKELEDQNILKDESKNLQTRNGTWQDTSDPYWYTQTVGSSFQMQWYGTGIRFWYLSDPTGGVWEFTLDGDQTATLSTWSSETKTQSVQLFMDAPERAHTIVAIFKGDDEKHKPSTGTGTSKGWVRCSETSELKTFEVYRLRTNDEKYAAVAEYTSPLANKYGIRIQAPEFDERFTDAAALQEHLKEILNDKIEISHQMKFVDLQKAGYPSPKPRIGDTIPYIVEELDLIIPDIRIMEIDEYPEEDTSPTIVLGNSREDYGESSFNSTKRQLDEIFDSRKGKIKNNVLEEAVKRATEALTNSLTQLEYPPGMGILARDPNDYNRIVVLRSSGLGVSTDGGVTFPNAVTADGVVTNMLTAGQIKTNNIQIIGEDNLFYWDENELIAINPTNQNKYVRLNSDGLYIARGAGVIERADGFKLVDDGYANFSYAVDMASPPPISNGVYFEGGRWYKQKNTEKGDVFFYSFEHVTRYLYLNLAFYAENGGSGYIYVDGSGSDTGKNYASFLTDHSEGNDYATFGRTFVADLGTPTGGTKSVYVRVKSNVADKFVAVRHIRGYLRG